MTVAETDQDPDQRRERFVALAMPQLDAAYNLARWLMRNEGDAADAVQDAYLRAFRSFGNLRGDGMRPWLLAIVRNACLTILARNQAHAWEVPYSEDEQDHPEERSDPEKLAMRAQQRRRIDAALQELPLEFREVVVLRDLQDLPYAEIARILDIPAGTVMSRLARGRARLARRLQADEGSAP
jgi:RNA polymerase sigma factor (sigma-70 family)